MASFCSRRCVAAADRACSDLPSKPAMADHRLALVSRYAGAGHRNNSSWCAIHGRPLHLLAEHRVVYHRGLGSRGLCHCRSRRREEADFSRVSAPPHVGGYHFSDSLKGQSSRPTGSWSLEPGASLEPGCWILDLRNQSSLRLCSAHFPPIALLAK